MKLNINCPINTTSYGYVSTYFTHFLQKFGVDVRHIPIGRNQPDDNTSKLISLNEEFHYDSACLKIWHQNQLHSFTGNPKFGYTIFELDDFNKQEVHSLNYPDLVISCSNWAKEVLSKHNIKSEVIPLGFDHNIFKFSPLPKENTTVFANFGKWEIRKGHDILIKAFEAAFTPEDNVLLVMCPTNPFLNENQTKQWENMYLGGKMRARVQLIPRLPNQKEVYNIIGQVHCGVFPSKAEGWNLEALEMMAAGRQLIITDCTGHKEFITKEQRIISMGEEMELAYDGVFFDGTRHWRKFGKDQFDQLVNHLREFHKNREQPKTNIQEFTWENSSRKLFNLIKDSL